MGVRYCRGIPRRLRRGQITAQADWQSRKPLPNTVATEKHIHEVFVRSLLAQKNHAEVRNGWRAAARPLARSDDSSA